MAGFLTNSGLAKLAVATPIEPMTVKYMAFDSGQGTPTPNMTALFNEVYRTEIPNPVKDPNAPKNLTFSGFVPTTVGGWTVYGVGLFDSLNVLIAYLELGEPVTKPSPDSALKMSWQQDFIITLENTGDTDLIITDSIQFRHDALTNRNQEDSHPISAITGLIGNLSEKDNRMDGLEDAIADVETDINTKDSKNVKLTGDQNISGKKIFTEIYGDGSGLDPATTSKKGVIQIATWADVRAGVVDNEAVSPFDIAKLFCGMVAPFAMNSCPSGWLPCDGGAVSRTTYARLFEQIGTTHGTGNGTTTFNLPELRGEFIRGYSGGRSGVDAGRSFGSYQDDELKSHDHQYKKLTEQTAINAGNAGILGNGLVDTKTTTSGGTETRPRNVALLYCIKY